MGETSGSEDVEQVESGVLIPLASLLRGLNVRLCPSKATDGGRWCAPAAAGSRLLQQLVLTRPFWSRQLPGAPSPGMLCPPLFSAYDF